MINNAEWICPKEDFGFVCPEFIKRFKTEKSVKKAYISISALGVYEAFLNGERIGDFVLAPGWTAYKKRLQYQTYDITPLLSENNEISVFVGKGWCRGRITSVQSMIDKPYTLIAQICVEYEDGTSETINTDESWSVKKSNIVFSDIYDGETYDALVKSEEESVKITAENKDVLIPQEGEKVCEHERIKPISYIVTPKGERVIDFGQEVSGYVEFCVNAKAGDKVKISHAEVLDKFGNFYTENYRSAKAKLEYICRDGEQTYKPHLTFFGFRYIRLDEYPGEVDLDNFTAVTVYSDIKQTGHFACSNKKLNKFFNNVLWSQRDNFIDVPTDCPQRDERLGWTGDAQVFAKTAAYNFDVRKFFIKWLHDMCADQADNGIIQRIVPYVWGEEPGTVSGAAAWSDVVTIVPWTMYMMYGDKRFLEDTYEAMKKWVDFVGGDSLDKYLWTHSDHKNDYGDWLSLDNPDTTNPANLGGDTDQDFISSAFYAYSVSLFVKTGNALGRDMSEYEKLYENIVKAFKERFNTYNTQTAHVLALMFNLTDEKQKTADSLAEMVKDGLKTGFVGAPYLLYALSDNGHTESAYDLLCREEYPSWLYPVNKGATTIWEHWDGIRDDGSFWKADMNSFNHYAYGSVMDWIYSTAAGIKPDKAGFESVIIEPKPSKHLEWLEASYETVKGTVSVKWVYENDNVRYDITVPSDAKIIIDGKCRNVKQGSYVLFGKA